jgi:hypothetical protein
LAEKYKNNFAPKFQEESNKSRKLKEFYPTEREHRNKSSVITIRQEYDRLLNKNENNRINTEENKTIVEPEMKRILDLNPNMNKDQLKDKTEKKENGLRFGNSSTKYKFNHLASAKENRIQYLKSNIFNLAENPSVFI